MILGTAAYMAPGAGAGSPVDQARRHLGLRLRALRDADGRARALRRRVTDSLAAILRAEPAWTRCRRLRRRRFSAPAPLPREGSQGADRNIAVARFLLDGHATLGASPADAGHQAVRKALAWTMPWVVAAVIAGAFMGGSFPDGRQARRPSLLQMSVLPADQLVGPRHRCAARPAMAISPEPTARHLQRDARRGDLALSGASIAPRRRRFRGTEGDGAVLFRPTVHGSDSGLAAPSGRCRLRADRPPRSPKRRRGAAGPRAGRGRHHLFERQGLSRVSSTGRGRQPADHGRRRQERKRPSAPARAGARKALLFPGLTSAD